MDVREKLVEIVKKAAYSSLPSNTEDFHLNMFVTNLLAHAVTVQDWIPLSEQKPNRDDLVLVFFEGMRDTPTAIQIMYGWCIVGSASHWMPLPHPPKGE